MSASEHQDAINAYVKDYECLMEGVEYFLTRHGWAAAGCPISRVLCEKWGFCFCLYSEYTKEQVGLMLEKVRNFISRLPA